MGVGYCNTNGRAGIIAVSGMRREGTLMLAATISAALACGDNRYVAVESWGARAPDLRVAVVLSTPPQVVVLVGNAPLKVPLEQITTAKNPSVRLWIFGYTVESLARFFPALRGKTPDQVAATLAFKLGDDDANAGPAPQADAVLSGDIDPGGPNDVLYAERTWSDWQASMAGTLRLTVPPDLYCQAVTVEQLDGPAGFTLSGIAATSAGTAIAAGQGMDDRLQLFRIESSAVPLGAKLAESGPIRDRMVWNDAGTGTGYLVARGGELVRFGPAGERLSLPAIPVVDAARQSFGPEAIGAAGDRVMAASYFLFNLNGTHWDAVQFNQGQARAIQMLRLVSAERLFFFNACWINTVEGTETRLLFPDITCGNGGGRTIRGVDADPDGVIVTGTRGRISIQSPTGDSLDRSGDLGSGEITVGLSVRGGRHLAAGDDLLALWFGTGWCRLPINSGLKLRFGSASRTGETAYVVAAPDRAGAPAPILRVTLPPP